MKEHNHKNHDMHQHMTKLICPMPYHTMTLVQKRARRPASW